MKRLSDEELRGFVDRAENTYRLIAENCPDWRGELLHSYIVEKELLAARKVVEALKPLYQARMTILQEVTLDCSKLYEAMDEYASLFAKETDDGKA